MAFTLETEEKMANSPDLSGCTATVKDRFDESSERAELNEDTIYFLDGMEAALVGTMVNAYGHTVAVYERELCIACLVKGFGENWMDEPAYGYTDEQKADMEFMAEEARTMAIEFFEYNTLRALPYKGEYAPVIIEGFMIDSDRWKAMGEA